ncbi:MAG: hypothetical protein ACM3JD_11535 [Rudaea sp.]
MTSLYRAAERASENLYEDESLRSNLTDEQAEIVLRWASDWISERAGAAKDDAGAAQIVAKETVRVRAVIKGLNKLAAGSTPTLAKAVDALGGGLAGGKPFALEEILTLSTTIASAAWKLRS